jgi:uncharacterized protein YggU (UPF0235/DUF167 family)
VLSLGALLVHNDLIQLDVTVTPTSDKTELPTVDQWALSYSCVDAE